MTELAAQQQPSKRSVPAAAQQESSELDESAQSDNQEMEVQPKIASHESGSRPTTADQTLLDDTSISAALPSEVHAASSNGESVATGQEGQAAHSQTHAIEQQLQQMALQPAQEGGKITPNQPGNMGLVPHTPNAGNCDHH